MREMEGVPCYVLVAHSGGERIFLEIEAECGFHFKDAPDEFMESLLGLLSYIENPAKANEHRKLMDETWGHK